MPSNTSTYPLRDIPVPYRYSSSNCGIIDLLSKSQNYTRSNFINSSTSINKNDLSTNDINISLNGQDKNVNNLVSSGVLPKMIASQTLLVNENEKRAREDKAENDGHRRPLIKKIKLMENTNTSTTKDHLVTEEYSQDNSTIVNANTTITTTTVLDDPLPLSPIASSGISTPDEKDLNELNDLGKPKIKNINNDNNSNMGIIFNNHDLQNMDPVDLQRIAYNIICNLNRSQLTDLNVLIRDNLKRDFISSLPIEIAIKILTKLSFIDIVHALSVCTTWNKIIYNTPFLWKHLLLSERFISKEEFKQYKIQLKKQYPLVDNIEDVYKLDFVNRCHILKNWYNPNFVPQRVTLKGHRTSVVTCLQFENDYIITGADDKMIRVYDSKNKTFLKELSGHDGGVWALKYDCDSIIVSGSTDRSVRIWDIKRGCCTHVFKGHTSTVRCLDIVEYNGVKYIVTGSRDNTLHVWKLDQTIYNRDNIEEERRQKKWPLIFDSTSRNPFFVGVLKGHLASVRTVSGHGNIVISGSYDNTLIVWDISKMKCLHIFAGHTDRIYSTIFDHKRNRCISASMDATIKIWDMNDLNRNGPYQIVTASGSTCTRHSRSWKTLTGHSALVGLLRLSDKYLVSAAADGSLKGWDSNDYSRQFAYHHDNLSAITTFCVDDNILVSGSEGQFNIYNLRNGELAHWRLLGDADQIWSVSFKNNILVVAVEKNTQSFIEILDFSTREPIYMTRL
ncbi:SCF ubiquitin ligase complex subunit CDC4 PWA37_000347 [Arxiozyma heterogenica]|uniref:F-box domain-containing protein n=1 Tax=Arxiozyma heterogenica TaxID=278026 RepID=A0AAN7W0C2_9SACH|nr:hypothetical protein RI543_004064 [Kazachstania heterogenica]